MPRLIDPGPADPTGGDAIGLDELVDTLDATRWDARDEEALAGFGPALARLARNRRFLGDLAIAELERRGPAGPAPGGYGAQVMVLRPPGGRYLLRANFWPALTDSAVTASGPQTFFYDHAHDHNFSFLTVGHIGPGYWSDFYEREPAERELSPGDPAGLTFAGRERLAPGVVLLYRAHRDVHVQLPPDAFSISLNILAYDRAQPWRTQYRFDVARDMVAEALTTTPSEALATVAAQAGGEPGRALAAELALSHPHPRMRATALAALASAMPAAIDRAAAFERAADDPDPLVARVARARLCVLARASGP